MNIFREDGIAQVTFDEPEYGGLSIIVDHNSIFISHIQDHLYLGVDEIQKLQDNLRDDGYDVKLTKDGGFVGHKIADADAKKLADALIQNEPE